MKTQKVYTFLRYLKSVPPVIYFVCFEITIITIFVSNFILTSGYPILEFHWTMISIFWIFSVIFLNFVVLFSLLFLWLFIFLFFSGLEFLAEGINEDLYNFFEKITDGLSVFLAFFLGYKIPKKYRKHISSMFFY